MKATSPFGIMLMIMSLIGYFSLGNAQEKKSTTEGMNKTMPCKMTSEPVPGAEIIVDLPSGKRATCYTNERGVFGIYLSKNSSLQPNDQIIIANTSITPPKILHANIANKNIELKLNKTEGNYFEFQLLGEQATSNSQSCKLTILPLQSKRINKEEEIPLQKVNKTSGKLNAQIAYF